jgi:hypothetical protein
MYDLSISPSRNKIYENTLTYEHLSGRKNRPNRKTEYTQAFPGLPSTHVQGEKKEKQKRHFK